jgi:hypothetical protein
MNGFAAPSRQSVMTLNFALVQFCLSATHMLYITYLTNHLLIFQVQASIVNVALSVWLKGTTI